MTFKDVPGKLPSTAVLATSVICPSGGHALHVVSISLRMSSVGHLKEPVLPIR